MENKPNLIASEDADADGYRASVGGAAVVGDIASVTDRDDTEDMASAVDIIVPDDSLLQLREIMQDRDRSQRKLYSEAARTWFKENLKSDPDHEFFGLI